MSLEVIEVETAPQPSASVIVLHGLGADGRDFIPICDELDLTPVGPVRFVFPHAPTRPVTINGGYVMRAWYDILGAEIVRQAHDDRPPSTGSVEREDEPGLRESLALVELLISRERERGVAASRIVLAGFSQGGAIALHTGLRHTRRLAGILALSTYVPLAETLAAEAQAANRDVPIFMAHGHGDTVIPYEFGQRSGELLQTLGYPIAWHPYFAEHTVCMEELRDIGVWLHEVFGAA